MKNIRIIIAAVCLFSLLAPVAAKGNSAGDPLPALVRLHVLANSESLADQRLKLSVRDELLAKINTLLSAAASLAEAEYIIKENIVLLESICHEVLAEAGVDYRARLQLGVFAFPDKYYRSLHLPAGRYRALNVTLGTGSGRNWWCVVFPSLCFTAEVCSVDGELQEEPKVRSKLLEWMDNLRAWWQRLL